MNAPMAAYIFEPSVPNQVLILPDLKVIERMFEELMAGDPQRLSPEEQRTFDRVREVRAFMQTAWDSWQTRPKRTEPGQIPPAEPERRVRVVRELFYQGPASWVDGTLRRMITKPTIMTRGLQGIGFVDGKLLNQCDVPLVDLPEEAVTAKEDL